MTLHAYPLFKVFYERAWYFIVRDQKTDSYYPCRLDRVLEAQVLAAPANEDYADNVADAAFLISRGWGMTFPKSYKELEKLDNVPETIVRFHSTVAPEGKRRHPCARIKHARDGSGDVFFHIRLLDHWEFKHWVRSFGSSATIIAPATIVDQERAEVVRTARNYGCESRLPRT